MEHALSCPFGGYPIVRHNEIRNLTANLLSEVCHNVTIEPTLPEKPSNLPLPSLTLEQDQTLQLMDSGVAILKKTFFDVRVLNPLAPSNTTPTPSACYHRHEKEKQRAYEQCIRDIEHASTPIVLFYKRLADRLSSKWNSSYSQTIGWL